MATSTISSAAKTVNNALFHTHESGYISTGPDVDPFQPISDAEQDAVNEAGYRGDARMEWRRNGFGRTIGGDARLPREFLPLEALHSAIMAVPLSAPMRLGYALAKTQNARLPARLRKDWLCAARADFGGWWGIAREWGFLLEGTRSGWYRLRVSPCPAWWSPLDNPYRPLEPQGTVVWRSRELRDLCDYFAGLAEAEDAALSAAIGGAR